MSLETSDAASRSNEKPRLDTSSSGEPMPANHARPNGMDHNHHAVESRSPRFFQRYGWHFTLGVIGFVGQVAIFLAGSHWLSLPAREADLKALEVKSEERDKLLGESVTRLSSGLAQHTENIRELSGLASRMDGKLDGILTALSSVQPKTVQPASSLPAVIPPERKARQKPPAAASSTSWFFPRVGN